MLGGIRRLRMRPVVLQLRVEGCNSVENWEHTPKGDMRKKKCNVPYGCRAHLSMTNPPRRESIRQLNAVINGEPPTLTPPLTWHRFCGSSKLSSRPKGVASGSSPQGNHYRTHRNNSGAPCGMPRQARQPSRMLGKLMMSLNPLKTKYD